MPTPPGARGEISSETGTLSGDERSSYYAYACNPTLWFLDWPVSRTVHYGMVGEPANGPVLQTQQNFLEQEGFVPVRHSVVFCAISRLGLRRFGLCVHTPSLIR